MIHLVLAACVASPVPSAQEKHPIGYDDTPMLPGSKWHVHDGKRPAPPVVVPGGPTTTSPPADAIVLFDGKDLSKWKGAEGKDAAWKVADGVLEITPGKGDLETKDEFGDVQLHLEWCEPAPPKSESQGRGNSGVFFMGRYELQLLDSYENPTYPDGQCGALYGQVPPLVNACRKPGEWQSYDVVFAAPRFENGKLAKPGTLTVLQNGVLVQDHAKLIGATVHRQVATYAAHGPAGPLKLQDHGDPLKFRNVWVRKLAPSAGS
jgi:3-keto-disaccharide hydrolase